MPDLPRTLAHYSTELARIERAAAFGAYDEYPNLMMNSLAREGKGGLGLAQRERNPRAKSAPLEKLGPTFRPATIHCLCAYRDMPVVRCSVCGKGEPR